MNFSSLSAADQRTLIAGGLVTILSILSFLDPAGNWGGVMILALLGGLGAVFVVVQPQVAPGTRLPASKGLLLLVLGAVSVAGFGIAMLSFINYVSANLLDIFVILMVVGLVAAIYLLWIGWETYRTQG